MKIFVEKLLARVPIGKGKEFFGPPGYSSGILPLLPRSILRVAKLSTVPRRNFIRKTQPIGIVEVAIRGEKKKQSL